MRAPSLAFPRVTRWPICSVSGIPLTGRSSRSANRIVGLSKRLSTMDSAGGTGGEGGSAGTAGTAGADGTRR
jgi:hypothetical protein